MEAISAALKSPMFANMGKIASAGSTGYNLFNQWQQQQYQNKLRSLAMDPAKMAKFAAGFTQPLNVGLTKGVGNQAQAFLAERGLSESPQISEQVISQAIAPYIQQNQQNGYQDALQALGLGGGAMSPEYQHQSGLNAITSGLLNMSGPKQYADPTQGTNAPQLPSFNPTPDPGPIDMSGWYANQTQPDLSAFQGG